MKPWLDETLDLANRRGMSLRRIQAPFDHCCHNIFSSPIHGPGDVRPYRAQELFASPLRRKLVPRAEVLIQVQHLRFCGLIFHIRLHQHEL